MEYNGYLIEPNIAGYAHFDFYKPEAELYSGYGKTIEDCKKQIDDLNLDEIHKDVDLLKLKQKKAMLSKKESFIKNMPKFTSCKTAYKKGFQDALKWAKENPEYL